MWRTDGRTDILPRHTPRYAYASHGKNGTIRKFEYGFLFAFLSRLGSILYNFFLRDAMDSAEYAVTRCLFACPSVRMSLRTSVTRRYSIETAKHIITFFTVGYSHTILVLFQTKRNGNILTDPPPLTRASNARGCHIFDQYLAWSRKWYKIVIVTMEGE